MTCETRDKVNQALKEEKIGDALPPSCIFLPEDENREPVTEDSRRRPCRLDAALWIVAVDADQRTARLAHACCVEVDVGPPRPNVEKMTGWARVDYPNTTLSGMRRGRKIDTYGFWQARVTFTTTPYPRPHILMYPWTRP